MQLPKIAIYKNPDGSCKGDAILTYEDPSAAQAAPGFFGEAANYKLRGQFPLKVEPAKPKAAPAGGYGGVLPILPGCLSLFASFCCFCFFFLLLF